MFPSSADGLLHPLVEQLVRGENLAEPLLHFLVRGFARSGNVPSMEDAAREYKPLCWESGEPGLQRRLSGI